MRTAQSPAKLYGSRLWVQRVGAFADLPRLIRELGGDPAEVLQDTGLDASALEDPDARIPYAAIVNLLDRAAEHTRCPHLGLLVGRMSRLDTLGPVGELIRHSSSVGAGLESLTVYQHLNSQGALAFVLRRGDFVDLGYAIYDPSAARAAHMYDAALATGMNIMLALCGPGWKPYEVFLSHAQPHNVAQYRSLFKTTPRFNAEFSALRFPARDLALPVPGADPAARLRAEQALKRYGSPELMQQVYRGVRRLLLQNQYSGDDLAQLLAMHRRTLNRRLKSEGTTFRRVLDEVRYEVSRDLLANANAHLDDVAASLGYSTVTSFMRTFRRWSGTTPGHWRRDARAGRTQAG